MVQLEHKVLQAAKNIPSSTATVDDMVHIQQELDSSEDILVVPSMPTSVKLNFDKIDIREAA